MQSGSNDYAQELNQLLTSSTAGSSTADGRRGNDPSRSGLQASAPR